MKTQVNYLPLAYDHADAVEGELKVVVEPNNKNDTEHLPDERFDDYVPPTRVFMVA